MNAREPPVLDYPLRDAPAPGAALELAPGLRWLRMPLPFALDHINVWLLSEPGGYTQIDSGLGIAATRELWEAHFSGTMAGRPLARVIATHYHPDHLGNAAWLAGLFGCPVAMTQAEFLTAHAVHAGGGGYATRDILDLFAAHGMAGEHLAAIERRGNQYRLGVPEVPAHFERLMAGDLISAGATHWRVIPGHGHSPEHAALHCAELGVLVSGDMLLPRISTNVSVWPSEPGGDPLARFHASLAAFEALPPDTLVLPSHGLPFRGIALRVAQLRAHHAARLDELEQAVAVAGGPVSTADIVPILFRRELDTQQRFFAMGEAIAHLNHLHRAGRVERRTGSGGAVRFLH